MKITSSMEYATRLMVSLAKGHGQSAVSAERLSAAENVPADYVNQLLLRLKRAGLVASLFSTRRICAWSPSACWRCCL